MAIDKERWKAVGPLLDQALDLSASERTQWLHELETQDPDLAADLAGLLEKRAAVSQESFLKGAAALPEVRVAEGHTLGAYTLVSRIGEGGMGTIWLARRSDGRFEGQAAVKLLNAHLVGRQGERFEREGSILARLSHPHIAHLVDAGVTHSGQPYLVLEYVEGQHINRYCESRRLDVEARVRLFLDVLDAVAHAHANLIVHRDLKPSNVLVRNDGEVKLLDFGIAKLLEGEGGADATALTREGGVMLTPAYAAPEQMTGGTITTATDVYSLGVLLFELLAGRHPAGDTARSANELYRAIVETEPPRLSTVATHPSARTLRGDLDTIVAKALKKKPGERYPSVAALAEDLRRYLDHRPIAARPESLAYRAARFVRRHRLPVALASLTLAALVAGLIGTIWQAREARRQRDLALTQLARADAMNEFTRFLLGEAIPDSAPIGVPEMLKRAEALVDKRFGSDEVLAVNMLMHIGDIYGLRFDSGNSRRATQRAYEASRKLADPAVRAHAACAWAGASYWDDREAALRTLDAALASLPREEEYNRIAAFCLLTRGQMAHFRDDSEATLAAAQGALDRLGEGPGASSFARVDALHLLALAHQMRGESGRAERAFTRAAEELDRIGGSDTNNGTTLLHNWGLTRALTDPLGALALEERILARSGSEAARDPGTTTQLLSYGSLLNRLGRYAEARRSLETTLKQAREQESQSTRSMTAMGVAIACRELGDLTCAEAAVRESVEAMRAAPDGDLYQAEVLLEPALLARARGDVEGARRQLTEALTIFEKARSKTAGHLDALVEMARLELRAGQAAQAEAHARKALALATEVRDDLPRSAWVGLSQLMLGEIVEARGDTAAARRLYGDALGQMTATLGEGHPSVKHARARLSGS